MNPCGSDHQHRQLISRLGSREAIAAAKCEITAALKPDGLVVIPAGDPLLESSLAAVWSGRIARVQLNDDPSCAAGLPTADLIGAISADRLMLNGMALPLPLEGDTTPTTCCWPSRSPRTGGSAPPSCEMQVAMSGGRNRRLQLGGLTVLDETYNASPERFWLLSICWRFSPVAASRCWGRCWNSATAASTCTVRWPRR